MSVHIYMPDPDGPIPRPVTVGLTCEGDHGLFPAPSIEVPVGWPTFAEATRLGWSVDSGRRPGPFVLCPECRR